MNTELIHTVLIRLTASLIAGALIGHERGRHGRAAGLRTHMLVSAGAALCSLVGIYMTYPGYGDPTRIPAGVVSGIGFIGAGIILLKGSNRITGLTTAAAMWATSAVGLAFGAGYYEAGIAGTLAVLVTLTFMVRFEIKQKKDYLYYIEIEDVYRINQVISEVKTKFPNSHSLDVLPSKSGLPGHAGISLNINSAESVLASNTQEILKIPGVVFVVRE